METQMLEHPALEVGHLVGVAAQKRQLVELGADGPFQSPHRISPDQFIQVREADHQLLAEHGYALAKGRRLRRNIVGSPGDHQVPMGLSLAPERKKDRGRLVLDHLERPQDLELLDILRQVAAREPQSG